MIWRKFTSELWDVFTVANTFLQNVFFLNCFVSFISYSISFLRQKVIHCYNDMIDKAGLNISTKFREFLVMMESNASWEYYTAGKVH